MCVEAKKERTMERTERVHSPDMDENGSSSSQVDSEKGRVKFLEMLEERSERGGTKTQGAKERRKKKQIRKLGSKKMKEMMS